MSLQDRVNELANLVAPMKNGESMQPGEMRAQYLAATYRLALLENTPPDLSQLHFLCILAATLGRFARDAAKPGEGRALGALLSALVTRHAENERPNQPDPTDG